MTTSQEWAERLEGYIPEEPKIGDSWETMAENAEKRSDWVRAHVYWGRVVAEAQKLQVRPDILAYYCRREDEAAGIILNNGGPE